MIEAARGHPRALFMAGLCFELGRGEEKDMDEAMDYYKQAAALGEVNAIKRLADGKAVEAPDPADDAKYYKCEGESENDWDALTDLATEYENKKEFDKAFEIYMKLATEDNDSYSQYYLALMYEKGEGVDKDIDLAMGWMTKAAEQGDAAAKEWVKKHGISTVTEKERKDFQANLKEAEEGHPTGQSIVGDEYYYGGVVEQDYEKAAYWYAKATEDTELAETDAAINLGDMYRDGILGEPDIENAIYYYEIAGMMTIKHGEVMDYSAASNLIEIYCEGDKSVRDYEKAAYWMKALVDEGDDSYERKLMELWGEGHSVDPFDLANKYYRDKDNKKVIYWLKKSAYNENPVAMKEYGAALCDAEDVFHGVKWLEKAANVENADAQYFLGRLYYSGTKVPRDEDAGIRWMIKAADSGHPKAPEMLDVFLGAELNKAAELSEVGNDAEAVKIYRKVVAQKCSSKWVATAAYNLAICYMNGQGVGIDYEQMGKWAETAHNKGYEDTKATEALVAAAKFLPYTATCPWCGEKTKFDKKLKKNDFLSCVSCDKRFQYITAYESNRA